jgi:methylthioribose-1-phosphate isomerase
MIVTSKDESLGLDGFYKESELPLLIKRKGMAIWNDGVVEILDRRNLPHSQEYIDCHNTEEVASAIEEMVIQGAFSISIAAGYGLALSAQNSITSMDEICNAALRLKKTRPTGLALSRILDLCIIKAENAIKNNLSVVDEIIKTTDTVASNLAVQARKTAQFALTKLNSGDTLLTHCFPDRSYVYLLMEAKYNNIMLNVICSETRPYLQGTKLSSWCASELGFNTYVISDGMGGALMKQKKINAFITAADTVCMDGSIANKVGTYQYALAANSNNVPYYVLRQSGPDMEYNNGDSVVIEERSGDDLLFMKGDRIAPEGVQGLYPCFDITPPELVSAIITDRGIFEPDKISTYKTSKVFLDSQI